MEYGIWILVGSIFRYRDILSMGLNSAVNRLVPVAAVGNDLVEIGRIVATARVFFGILAAVLSAVTLAVYFNLDSWFNIDEESIEVAKKLTLIIGIGFSISIPFTYASAVLSGFQRYDIINVAVLIPSLVRTAVIVILLSNGFGLLTMGVLFSVSELVIKGWQLTGSHRFIKSASVSLKNADMSLFREMWLYGMNTFMYTSSALFLFKASDLVIAGFLNTESVTRFAVTAAPVILLSQLVQTSMGVIKPAISDMDARVDSEGVRRTAILTQKYSLIILLPASTFLLVMGSEFLQVWLGPGYGDLWTVLSVLTIAHFIRLSQYSNFLVLVGKGEHKVFGLFSFAMGIGSVCLAAVATGVFSLGLVGVALSNLIPICIVCGFVLPKYFAVHVKITLWTMLRDSWGPAFMSCLPAMALILMWKILHPPGNWPEMAAVVVSILLATVIGSWSLGFSALERRMFTNAFGLRGMIGWNKV